MKQNNAQYEAIMHNKGPAMVLAGPGAGKTYVITNRIKNLIEEYDVPAQNILVVTFSKAATVEMKERFDSMMGEGRYPVWFGTFHSVFFRILQAAYHYEAKDIVTSSLKYRFLEEALSDTSYETDDTREFIENIEKEISRVKGEGIDIDCYYSTNCPEQVFRDIFNGYQERLQRHHCIDFDDMVVYTYQLLREREDIRARWQGVFTYILIDEFQDISPLQYETICMLAAPEDNLFIVGDDDQSIYGFRGARPDIMLGFPKRYTDTRQITLGVNYRCSDQILGAATRLIVHNKKRYKKDLSADAGKCEGVHIGRSKDLAAEADKMVQDIQNYHKQGMAYEDMAILFRTNMQMRVPAGKLMEHGIPFSMKEHLPNMFDTWMAKDIMCYVRIALGSRSREDFIKIANRPLRYISRAAFSEPEVKFQTLRSYYVRQNKVWMLERLREFEDHIRALAKMTPYSAINYIRKGIGYDHFLIEYAKERNVGPDDWMDVLDEIQETARDKKNLDEWLAYVKEYGEMLEEMSKTRQGAQTETEGVRLMTMHGSKGLEFTTVFIPTVNEDIVPYRKSIQSGDIEEERRMLYVAMTRAKRHLHLSFVKERFHKKSEPSRFLFEISPQLQKKLSQR